MADINYYNKQASSIYDPQLKADIAQAANKKKTALVGLDTEQKTIEPEYQKALRGVDDAVRDQTGQINMLYSQRLGGQFSGLQGNDMGMMYSKANATRGDIETTRANKLAEIASRRTLANNAYTTEVNSLQSRYRGLKSQYAQSAYNAAVRAEQQAELEREKMARADARAAASARAPSASEILRSDANALYTKLSTLAGRDGYISPASYAAGLQAWQAAGHSQKEYDSLFSGLRNPNNTHYRLATGWGS